MILETDWLKRWSRYSPSSVAVKDADSGDSYSYSVLYRLSCELARKLESSFAVRKGDRVAVLATNEIEYVPLFFATQRLGAILVPINFRLTHHEIDHIIADSGARILIAQDEFADRLEKLNPKAAPGKRWSFDGAEDSLRSFVRQAEEGCRGSAFETEIRRDSCAWDFETRLEFDDPCMILYTSGTTGAPKGALITHKMMFWNSVSTGLRLNLTQSDVTLSFLPFFHTGGWNVLNTPFFHRGAKIILMKKFDPEKALALCASERATILFGVPTTLDMMSRSPSFATTDLSSLRFAIVGGEPMPLDLIRLWQSREVPIRQGFGMTEFGPNVFSLSSEDSLRKIGSIGFANPYVDVRIVDDQGRDVEAGETGELLLRGPACTPGYWENPSATQDAIRDGWFYTGDLVRRDDEGYFYVAGRKKDMFISGGENVYPVEIERHLSTHPQIREVAVVGVPDTKWGEVGKAFIATTEGAALSTADVLSFCEGRLARFKIPKYVEFLATLPKGESGKLLKRSLRSETGQTVS